MRKILAVVIGIVVALFVVYSVELAGHQLYPEVLINRSQDTLTIAEQLKNMPIIPMLFPAFAWFLGAFFGGFWARIIDENLPLPLAILPGVLVAVGALNTIMAIPHPMWFVVVGLFLAVAGIYYGQHLGKRVNLFK